MIEPYMVIPNMSGTIGIRNLPDAEIDANPDDILSNLRFGGMLYLEANNDNWAITSDILYMDLQQNIRPGLLISSGDAAAKQLAWEFTGLYRVLPFFESGIGGRLNNIKSELDINRIEPGGETTPVSGESSDTWFDPIVLVRLTADINDKWLFQFRGDVNGFGIG